MFKRFLSFFILLFVLFIPPVFAESVEQLPLGQAAVIDMANVLSPAEKQAIDERLRQMNSNNGMQPAIVIVNSTDGVSMLDYSMDILNRWQLGDTEKNNGLLLLIAVKDRQYRTTTGYGLEGDLTDAFLSKIQREHFPSAFRENKYAVGINAVLDKIEKRMVLPPAERQQLLIQESNPKDPEMGWVMMGLTALFSFIAALSYSRDYSRIVHTLITAVFLVPLVFLGILYFLGYEKHAWWIDLLIACAVFVVIYFPFVLFFKWLSKWLEMDLEEKNYSSSTSRTYIKDDDNDRYYKHSSSSRSSSSGSRSYSGGGGRSGGGGAGGSW